jgi:hypothetical protein
MIEAGVSTNIQWIAGYSESVDFIDSSAIDMVFGNRLLSERDANSRRRQGNKKSHIELVKIAASGVATLMPGIFREMGFNVYIKDQIGQASPLLAIV